MRAGASDARVFNSASPAQHAVTHKCVDTLVVTNDLPKQPCVRAQSGLADSG